MFRHNLQEFLSPWIKKVPSCTFSGLTLDSRSVDVGDLFLAVKGTQTDGRLYIFEAIKKGVSVVLSQSYRKDKKIEIYNDTPIIHIHNLKKIISSIAGRFYNYPSNSLKIIGVTGTNGKTTITHLLAQWIQLLGERSAIIGTIGNGTIENIEQCNNITTPSPIEIQKILLRLCKIGVKTVAMEVSSHGLSQYRVDDLHFSAAVFSNLSHDHLDFHSSMKKYELSKWRLFSQLSVDKCIINTDDPIGRYWIQKLPEAIAVGINYPIPYNWKGKWVLVNKIEYNINGLNIFFSSSFGNGKIISKLIGNFNIDNIILALATLLSLGYPISLITFYSKYLIPVSGRMELFVTNNNLKVLIDYAHSPDALKKALISARSYCNGDIWCIFGCGGNRDKNKRPIMGSIAEQYADRIILTNDNPRNEPEYNIINSIKQGIVNKKYVKTILDRKMAIINAISQAKSNDLILIAGKGHEEYQYFKKEKVSYSDILTVKKILKIKNVSY